MIAEKSESLDKDEEILRVMRERFALAEEADRDQRIREEEDARFAAGEQWPEDLKRSREQDGRPCLVVNRMPQTIRAITNDQRQNRPSIKVYPVDDNADPETAKILQGVIRHIEYNSGADVAYDTASDSQIRKGRGYFRIITDYVDPTSFNQELLIKRIRNSASVYLDPNHQEPDGSDAKWGFIFTDVPAEDFKAENPESEVCKSTDWGSMILESKGWIQEHTVRVAEYFYFDNSKKIEIAELIDGTIVEVETLPEDFDQSQIVRKRQTVQPQVKWVKTNGTEILDRTDWLGRFIPIIKVIGEEIDINGEVRFEGIVSQSKDPQRMYNYWASTETETISLAPKAPFIAAEGQTEDYANEWQNANRVNHSVLTYKPTSHDGNLVPPPQRNVTEPPIQAITQARMLSADDIKSTTGYFDSALGSRGNEVSGVAIRQRAAQSQNGSFHFSDNLTRSLRYAGRILVDLIPKVYDAAQAIRIIGEEGDQEIVRINQVFERNGKSVEYKLGYGKYDVAVETGPSFATKRQEAAAAMMEFSKAIPAQAAMISDLIVKGMDWPGATDIAERLKKLLPPNLIDDKQQPEIPPQVQQQMQQMGQMIEALTAKLNESNDIIKAKVLDIESRERIENAKIERDLLLEQMKVAPNQTIQVLVQELAQVQARLDLLGFNEPVEQTVMEMNGPGPEQAADPIEQQPTGGLAPGPIMGV